MTKESIQDTQQSKYGAITKSLWFNTAIISKHLDNSLGAIHGIGLTEYMVLLHLMKAPNHALRRIDIADALARTASGITRLLMPMEKIGLVEKEINQRDARVSLVKVTPAGEELFKNASITVDAKSETLLKNIDSKKANTFLNLLNTI
ncbi:MarR family winged helix-turn-helix transcriptional regulator [Agarilytica rhodophyticola]|uniref:MarR family winged helix-turn-helix transcriptional regulator n=1 Tax=Agarilytica rhodophyticola TaxID=1737490 RepID=UPI000B342B98|nr:MarR family winged helix-turn-helix transcriptional regulator [Agarilytica rhodophyticola]